MYSVRYAVPTTLNVELGCVFLPVLKTCTVLGRTVTTELFIFSLA